MLPVEIIGGSAFVALLMAPSLRQECISKSLCASWDLGELSHISFLSLWVNLNGRPISQFQIRTAASPFWSLVMNLLPLQYSRIVPYDLLGHKQGLATQLLLTISSGHCGVMYFIMLDFFLGQQVGFHL